MGINEAKIDTLLSIYISAVNLIKSGAKIDIKQIIKGYGITSKR